MSGWFDKTLSEIQDNKLEILQQTKEEEEEKLCLLVEALKRNKSVTTVSIDYYTLGVLFANALRDALKVNQSVINLNFWANCLGNVGARAISEALKVNQNIKFLKLGFNDIGDEEARLIAKALKVNNSVTVLNLGDNGIGDKGARAIAKLLKVNKNLKELYLYGNDIGCEGASAISEALKVNYSLKKISLRYNRFFFSPEGVQDLLETFKTNGTLTDITVDNYQDQINKFCKRNQVMHKRTVESVVHLLALRKMGRTLWIPKEIMAMIGQMLWETKCEIDAWNK